MNAKQENKECEKKNEIRKVFFVDGKKYERGKNVDNAFIKQSSLAWVLETLHHHFFGELLWKKKHLRIFSAHCLKHFLLPSSMRGKFWKFLKTKHKTMKHCQQSFNILIGATYAQLKTMRVVPEKNLKDLIRVQLGWIFNCCNFLFINNRFKLINASRGVLFWFPD